MRAFIVALILVIAGVLARSLHAQSDPYRERPFFQASRALAMGDAYTAYNADFEAVYYNPAGLAKVNELQIKPFDIETVGSQDLAFFFKNTFRDVTKLRNFMDQVQRHQGSNYSAGINFLPQLLVKNFSFGLLARGLAEGRITETSNMELYSYADFGGYLHTAFALAGGIIKIGGGVKILDRAEMAREYTPAQYTQNLTFEDEWREGFGVGYDAGIMLQAPVTFHPTLAVAIQDIGNTSFEPANNIFKTSTAAEDGAPRPIRQRINAGISFKVKHGRNIFSTLAGEVKDIGNISEARTDHSYTDHIHGGWELNIRNILYLRAGVNQGIYWTGGLGLHVGGMALEFSSYGENVAFFDRPRVDDRKYVGRYAIMF
jgi:hypothetical protein